MASTTKKLDKGPRCNFYSRLYGGILLSAASLIGLGATAEATPRDTAFKIFNRINGVPPAPAVLDAMEAKVASGDLKGAAMDAINDQGSMFYNVTIKNMAARWSNADKTPRVALNDFVATVIGMVRDDVPFTEVLSGDIIYTGAIAGIPAYSLANNNHYEFLENSAAKLSDPAVLARQSQAAVSGLPAEAVAGVLSTRGFGDAYYKAGTNRRAVAFTLGNFLCREMEQLMDTTRSDLWVRRDVNRAPGGDAAMFRNKCAGCHTGMDGFGGAFAYYDWDDTANALIYTPGQVRPKFNRNTHEFPEGHPTNDDSWVNMWIEGQNSSLGWDGTKEGNGAKEWGAMITATEAFSQCMAEHSFKTLCLRSPAVSDVKSLAESFKSSNYSMKALFAETAASCLDE